MISVLMTTYNEPISLVKESIESILTQTYTDLELVIIVDNSKNNEILDYLNNLNDKRVNILINSKNIGLPLSLNKGIEYAHGNYIARMDADDVADKSRLEKQLEYLEKNGLDLVSSNSIDIDEDGKIIGNVTKFPCTTSKIYKYLNFGSSMLHPTWLGTKEAFEELNGYRNIYSCEDYDFLIRGALKKLKFGNTKDCLLKKRIRNSSISESSHILQEQTAFLLKKNYRKKKVTSLKEIQTFINGDEFRELRRKIELSNQLFNEYKNKDGISRLIFLFKISINNSMVRKEYILGKLYRQFLSL